MEYQKTSCVAALSGFAEILFKRYLAFDAIGDTLLDKFRGLLLLKEGPAPAQTVWSPNLDSKRRVIRGLVNDYIPISWSLANSIADRFAYGFFAIPEVEYY